MTVNLAIRGQNDYDTDAVSLMTATEVGTDDNVHAEFADEADINVIVAKFLKTGQLGPVKTPVWGDADFTLDLQQATATINEVKRAWESMPDATRAKYPTWEHLAAAIDSGDITSEDIHGRRKRAESTPLTDEELLAWRATVRASSQSEEAPNSSESAVADTSRQTNRQEQKRRTS